MAVPTKDKRFWSALSQSLPQMMMMLMQRGERKEEREERKGDIAAERGFRLGQEQRAGTQREREYWRQRTDQEAKERREEKASFRTLETVSPDVAARFKGAAPTTALPGPAGAPGGIPRFQPSGQEVTSYAGAGDVLAAQPSAQQQALIDKYDSDRALAEFELAELKAGKVDPVSQARIDLLEAQRDQALAQAEKLRAGTLAGGQEPAVDLNQLLTRISSMMGKPTGQLTEEGDEGKTTFGQAVRNVAPMFGLDPMKLMFPKGGDRSPGRIGEVFGRRPTPEDYAGIMGRGGAPAAPAGTAVAAPPDTTQGVPALEEVIAAIMAKGYDQAEAMQIIQQTMPELLPGGGG